MLAVGARLGEMTTGGYTLLEPPRPRQQLDPRPRRCGGAGARLRAPTCWCIRRWRAAALRSPTLEPPAQPRWGGVDARRACRLRSQPACRRRSSPLDMAEVVRTHRSLRARGHDLHQRRRQLQPAGCIASIATPGLRHAGRTQLAPTSGAMGYGVPAAVAASLLQPAPHGDQHRRRRRLPDDRPGAGDRRRARRRQRREASSSASSSTTAATARSACTRSASTRAASRAPISATPTSPRWPAPTAGARRPGRHDGGLRAGACAPRSPARRPALIHSCSTPT